MSMGANPSIMVDVLTNNAQLGVGLRQAEAQVAQSTARMARQTEKLGKAWANSTSMMLTRFAGPAMAMAMADRFTKSFVDSLTKRSGFINAVYEAVSSAFESVPIGGAFPAFARQFAPRTQGIPVGEARMRKLLLGETILPEDAPAGLAGQTFRSGTGGLLGFLGIDDLIDSMIPGGLATVQKGGVSTPTDPRRIEHRISKMQDQLREATPKPTRDELMSEQMSRAMGGAMGQAQTALGTFKFTQIGADAQKELVDTAKRQVDIMMRIQEATEELRKLTASN